METTSSARLPWARHPFTRRRLVVRGPTWQPASKPARAPDWAPAGSSMECRTADMEASYRSTLQPLKVCLACTFQWITTEESDWFVWTKPEPCKLVFWACGRTSEPMARPDRLWRPQTRYVRPIYVLQSFQGRAFGLADFPQYNIRTINPILILIF